MPMEREHRSIDWPAIKAQYEQGVKQNSLAREYGITQQAISKRAVKEGWIVQAVVPPTTFDNFSQHHSHLDDDGDPHNILTIIHVLLKKVAQHADQDNLDVKDIKLLADAISQFHKIYLTSPSNDKPTESGIAAALLPYLTMRHLDRLAELRAEEESIYEEARAAKLEAEQGIKTIHHRQAV
jgi:hypothetical protein